MTGGFDRSEDPPPSRPPGAGSSDAELDDQARAVLDSAGVADLRAGLAAQLGIVQAAAARLLGAGAPTPEVLEDLAGVSSAALEETVRVEAGYALCRLGDDRGRAALKAVLALPLEASPGPLQAAGALARLGDSSGIDVVQRGLASANPVTAIVAAKQIEVFAALADPPVQLPDLFAAAARHPDARVQGAARR